MSMKKPEWYGILRVIDVQHRNAEGELLWEAKDIYNMLHRQGEEFLLRAAFTGGSISTIIPDNYYLGLDNRSAVALANTMTDVAEREPDFVKGYQRQPVSSSGDFSINIHNDHYVATSPIVAFQATTGAWGPVSNLFLSDKNDDTGYLIATAIMPGAVIVNAGESITMRIGMQLRPC